MSNKVMIIGEGGGVPYFISLLKKAGFDTAVIAGEMWGEDEREQSVPAIVVVDEETAVDGWQLCSRIRRESSVPIIVVGDSDSESSWVKAAIYGVDYYASWTIKPQELVARVRALLRRHERMLTYNNHTLK